MRNAYYDSAELMKEAGMPVKDSEDLIYSLNPRHKDNLIIKLTFEFSIGILKYTSKLEEDRNYVIAKQLLRSGTSVGANVRESQNAESKADFIHKLKISLKEVDETEYWLLLCKEVYKHPEIETLLQKITVIYKALNKIVSSTKQKK